MNLEAQNFAWAFAWWSVLVLLTGFGIGYWVGRCHV